MSGPNGFDSDSGHVVGRVGDTVRRTTHPWTPAVHRLLDHLEAVGFPSSPRARGYDEHGHEILTYLDGASGADVWPKVATDDGLRAYARLFRGYHDAVVDYRPTETSWAMGDRPLGAGDIIAHGDFGPWNTVWKGDTPVGIVDWDLSGPRPKLYDVAYALEYGVPFRDDHECVRWLGYRQPPDRAHRIEVFAEAYGLSSVDGLVDEVIGTQEAGIAEVRVLADRGVRPQAEWVAGEHLAELHRRVAWSREHRHLFE